MKHLLILPLCLAALSMFAAKPEPISITYDYRSNDRNESQAQAEQHAIEKAKQRALENKFGVDVSSIIVTRESEQANNGKYTTSEDFFSLGGTIARGEWLSTEKEEILSSKHNGEYWHVQVYVAGTAREKSGTPIDIHYAFVRHAKDRDNCIAFKDGDDLPNTYENQDKLMCPIFNRFEDLTMDKFIEKTHAFFEEYINKKH